MKLGDEATNLGTIVGIRQSSGKWQHQVETGLPEINSKSSSPKPGETSKEQRGLAARTAKVAETCKKDSAQSSALESMFDFFSASPARHIHPSESVKQISSGLALEKFETSFLTKLCHFAPPPQLGGRGKMAELRLKKTFMSCIHALHAFRAPRFLQCIGKGTFGRVYLVRKRDDAAQRPLRCGTQTKSRSPSSQVAGHEGSEEKPHWGCQAT